LEQIADILLVAGALGAGFYCFVLARRLNRFNDLEKGVGGAVAVLSSQVDDLNATLAAARDASDGSNTALGDLTGRAEAVANRLELLLASLHDIPDQKHPPEPGGSPPEPVQSRPSDPPAGPMFVRRERVPGGIAQ
jgi:hypothetical protein